MRKIRLMGLLLMCVSNLIAYGQQRSIPPRKKPTLSITHPLSHIKVVFSDPAFVAPELDDSAWKRLTIYLPNHKHFVLKAGRMDGFMMNSDTQECWSPDGLFLSVWETYGIIDKDTFSGQRIAFVNLSIGYMVHFRSRDGFVTTDNFGGWYPHKGHVIKKGADTPSGYEEAYGPGEDH